MNQKPARPQHAADSFSGAWRITEMELWDREDFELLGPAHITFDRDALGKFQFIAVEGFLDCRFTERDGKPLVEFSWDGHDENDPASGRGWALIDGDTITGRIYFHRGDDSAFVAKRSNLRLKSKGKSQPRRDR